MSTRKKPTRSDTLSRRRFVALVAAGSAALIARPADAATATVKKVAKGAAPAPARAAKPAASSEFDRQRAATLETLKTIRAHALGAGADLGFVFRPVRRTRGK